MHTVGTWVFLVGLALGSACAAPQKRATYIVAVPGKGVVICRLEHRLGSSIEYRVCRPPGQRREQHEALVVDAGRRRGRI
ncbi:MAG: hypothetical protein IPI49_16175 [Myxococcales bacterium]|nr:hypothetical protein [Myxococcales bacterium]